MSAAKTKFARRPYEQVALVTARKIRQLGLYWARRCRKSTNLGSIFFDHLSAAPNRMAVAASASLLLGRELVTVTLNQAEQALVVQDEAAAVQSVFTNGAGEKDLNFQVANMETGKVVNGFTPVEFAEMYRASKLELRLYFDKTSYSRLQVIAPNPATARSWRALVGRDEVGYTAPQFEQALQIATDAMMRDTPDLKMIYASNAPQDDRHPWFTMTLPRDVTAPSEEEQFPANPKGHLYIGQTGMTIHRVALADAYAAGHRLFDDHGKPMEYDAARKFGPVKMGWDISYGLNHKSGGASAIDLIALITAMQRGAAGGCYFAFVDNDGEFRAALEILRARIGKGSCTIGVDVATTTGETSNPTSVTVTEDLGGRYVERLKIYWRERKEAVQRDRLRAIIECLPPGQRKKLVIDGTSERLFAEGTATEFRGLIPTLVIVASEKVEPTPPGYEQTGCNYKTYQGDIYAQAINDGRVDVPSDKYVKDDLQMVLKDAGRFVCAPDPSTGMHGDGFDSGKHALYGHSNNGGHTGYEACVSRDAGNDDRGEII
jgi:hypothetical protein